MEACACPAPASLTTILKLTCKENLGQIQRFLFQRAGFVFDTEADPVTDIMLLASWTPLFAAVNATKVVSTPYVENFVIPRTEAVTEGGGDNSTLDGVEIIVGANAVRGIGQIAETPSNIIMQVRKLMCEPDLVVFMLNQWGQIIGRNQLPGTPGQEVIGIPVRSLFTSDSDNNGLNTRDKADFSFGLEYGWRDNLAVITPAFNAKTLLWPA